MKESEKLELPKYGIIWGKTGAEIVNSYTAFWDKYTIDFMYKKCPKWQRSKFSCCIEWFIHTLCYKLGYQKERAKSVFLEFNKSWFKNLFKK